MAHSLDLDETFRHAVVGVFIHSLTVHINVLFSSCSRQFMAGLCRSLFELSGWQ